jgi:regulator of sirC expression with transglutaminase-like and TPR domain
VVGVPVGLGGEGGRGQVGDGPVRGRVRIDSDEEVVEGAPSEVQLVQTLIELAAMHNQAGRYKRGMQMASAALTLDPKAAQGYFYRGMAYNGMGNRTQAIQDLRHAAHLGESQAHDVLRAWGAD